MPRRLLKRLSPPRHRVLRQRWLQPLRQWLDHPDLWAIRRRAVVPGIAIGLFWLWMPIPGHSIAAGLSAIALRIHLPLAMLMTFVVNPLTILPIYYAGYRLGVALLDAPALPASEDLLTQLDAIWQPLLAGCLLLGIASAAVGYLVLDLVWRTRVGQYLQARRERLAARQRS